MSNIEKKRGVGRPKKKNVPSTFKLDMGIHNQLTKFAKENGKTKTQVVEDALRLYFDNNKLEEEIRERLKKELKEVLLMELS